MSDKLTTAQLREARIRMEGEHAIKRKIKDKIMKHMPVTAAIPITMDIEDELTSVKAERDELRQDLLDYARSLKDTQDRIDELEAALKAKLF